MLPVRSGKQKATRAVFDARMMAKAMEPNRSPVVGLIIGESDTVRVTMTAHEDGSFTVVEDVILPARASRIESRRRVQPPRVPAPTIRPSRRRRSR